MAQARRLTASSSLAETYQKVFSANSTGSSTAIPADSLTEPSTSTAGVLDIRGSTADVTTVPDYVRFEFFGTDAANQTFNYAIYGWAYNGTSWSATKLVAGVATLGAKTGVASGGVLNTELYADTVTVTAGGVENVSYWRSSPADDTKAYLIVDCAGFPYLQVLVDIDSSATNVNLLYARL